MPHLTVIRTCFAASLWLCASVAAHASDWSGNIALETRTFLHEGTSTQRQFYPSISAQPEYHHSWESNKQSITFAPFVRIDRYVQARTHLDIRELNWLSVGNNIEWRVGIRKVFWGVTESQHLVDIINQTDALENPSGEDKLGQPMVNVALLHAWGTLDVFVLPVFRPRTFVGEAGRPRLALPVDTGAATYEAANNKRHVDFAMRWRKSLGDWDLGLSQFVGTSREPRFKLNLNSYGAPTLTPHYDLISQIGVDVQATLGSWLWKLEGIRRVGQGATFNGITGGFEYTLPNIAETGIDAGFITEYLYDNRGQAALTPFQNDVMFGVRLALNDEQSSEILAGGIFDRDQHTQLYRVEASRRLGSDWKLNLEGRLYTAVDEQDLLFSQRNDNAIQIELARYF